MGKNKNTFNSNLECVGYIPLAFDVALRKTLKLINDKTEEVMQVQCFRIMGNDCFDVSQLQKRCTKKVYPNAMAVNPEIPITLYEYFLDDALILRVQQWKNYYNFLVPKEGR